MNGIGEPKYLDSDDGEIRVWLEGEAPRMAPLPAHYDMKLWRRLAFHAIQQRRDRHQRWINSADRWLRAAAKAGWDRDKREGKEGRA